MRTVVHLSSWPSPRWSRKGPVEVCGCSVRTSDGSRLESEELASFFACPRDQFEARLGALAGSFAVVHYDPAEREGCRAAVDPLRSIPLFYGCDGQTRFVTDDPYWLADRLQSTDIDNLSALFYLLQGLVPGEKTLLPGVQQLQAGHLLEASEHGWRCAPYCRYCNVREPGTDQSSRVLGASGGRVIVSSEEGPPVAGRGTDAMSTGGMRDVAGGRGVDTGSVSGEGDAAGGRGVDSGLVRGEGDATGGRGGDAGSVRGEGDAAGGRGMNSGMVRGEGDATGGRGGDAGSEAGRGGSAGGRGVDTGSEAGRGDSAGGWGGDAGSVRREGDATGGRGMNSGMVRGEGGLSGSPGTVGPTIGDAAVSVRGQASIGETDPLVERGVSLFERVGDRLIRRVAGRTPVVPLSGGLDSRLVAFLLVEGGRTDTLCYTYGRPGGQEVRVSRQIAQALGLQWFFIPYTNRLWAETYRSPEYQAYRRFAARLASIEHEQDWPAVKELKTRRWIPEDAVFVPGHSGDFLAGSHLPAALDRGQNQANPVDWVMDRYLTLWPKSGLGVEEMACLRAEVARGMGKRPDERVDLRSAVRLYDCFGLRERQAKLIVNSVRVYDFFGFEWALPLWDPEMIAFWLEVPLSERMDKRLYREVVGRLGPTMRRSIAGGFRPGLREKIHRSLDLDYRRYGMYLGPHPLCFGLRNRLGNLSAGILMPLLQKVIEPVRRHPPQTRPLNALIALHQVMDLVRGGI